MRRLSQADLSIQVCEGAVVAIDAMGAEATNDATVFWLKAHSTTS